MDERKINRNLLLIFRVLCTLVGAAIGIISIWQVFEIHPDLVKSVGLKVVFYIACGALPAAVLLLSAKQILCAVLALCDKLKSRFSGVKAAEVACVMIGLVMGVLFGFACELLTELFLDIAALRIMIAVVVAVIAAYAAVALCLKFTKKAEFPPAESEAEDISARASDYTGEGGYVLSRSALGCEKTITLCEKWLSGEVFVFRDDMNDFVGESSPEDADVVKRFKALEENGKIKVCSGAGGGDDELISFALDRNLKILALNGNSVKETSVPVAFLSLDEL